MSICQMSDSLSDLFGSFHFSLFCRSTMEKILENRPVLSLTQDPSSAKLFISPKSAKSPLIVKHFPFKKKVALSLQFSALSQGYLMDGLLVEGYVGHFEEKSEHLPTSLSSLKLTRKNCKDSDQIQERPFIASSTMV